MENNKLPDTHFCQMFALFALDALKINITFIGKLKAPQCSFPMPFLSSLSKAVTPLNCCVFFAYV